MGGPAASPEPRWQAARLIPTSGISGQDEAERRATSALLAVMGSVREFGQALVKPLGAPAGPIATYIEVPFTLGEQRCIPDGLIQTARGAKTWTALVEVKTGAATLERAQVESYLDVAREQGFDVVLTISNQIAPAPGVHPVTVDRRKLRTVALHHLSWAEVVTAAVRQRVHRGVSDPDQAWILGELIRYLEHPKSGALDFSDMGTEWVTVREAVAAGTLRGTDKGLAEVVSRWEQLLRFAALRLGRELGAEVQVQLSRREQADPSLRARDQATSLATHGTLTGTLKIPDAVAPLEVVADLRSGKVTVSVDVAAPREGRPTTRVNWLVRQLKDAPAGLRIEAFAGNVRTSTSELLGTVREDPAKLIADPNRELRVLRVAATSALGTKRGTGRGAFIDSVLAAIDGFYSTVVQQVRPWATRAPQLPKGSATVTDEAGIDLTPPPGDLTDDGDGPGLDPGATRAETEATVSTGWLATNADEASGHADHGDVSWDTAQERLDRERRYDAPPDPDRGAGAALDTSDEDAAGGADGEGHQW